MERLMLGTLALATGMMMASVPHQATPTTPDVEERHNASLIDACIAGGNCAFDENQLVDGGFLRLAPPPSGEAQLQPLPAEELEEEQVLPPVQELWLANSVQL